MPDTKTYKVGDRVWWWHGHILIRCTITRVDDQWTKENLEGILFYELDEPTGHSIDADVLHETLKEAVGDLKDWEEVEVDDDVEETTLDEFRRKSVRFILSTHLEGPDYGKTEKVSDAEVDRALVEWGYPPKRHGEDWLTAEEAIEKVMGL